MSEPCYALYKGDEFIDLGGKARLAKRLGVKVETITFYMSQTWRRRTGDRSYIVIRIED